LPFCHEFDELLRYGAVGVRVVEEDAFPLLNELLLGGALSDGDDAASGNIVEGEGELLWAEICCRQLEEYGLRDGNSAEERGNHLGLTIVKFLL
jgi:hypothetical protein